ncbi:MAG: c-type cytochrome, partial [Pseudomonadota bacterium]
KKCSSCHNVEPGGANGVGPALHGVMGRDIASVDGYGYSQALLAYGEGKQWTWEEMNGFLWKPKTYVKGTAMGFAGIRGVEDRANIVAYLNAQSDSPLDLPDPAAMEVMAEGDEAEGTVAASAVAPETEAAAENLVEGAVEGTDAAANTDAADNPAVTGMGGEEPETPATE